MQENYSAATIEMLDEVGKEWQIEKEPFIIDDDKKADWALRIIAEKQKARDRLCDVARDTIHQCEEYITKKEQAYERDTQSLMCQLQNYFESVQTRETKTKKTYELPSGKLTLKKSTIEYVRNENDLLVWAKENTPEYVKVEEKAQWIEIKKRIEVQDEIAIDKETGEIVNGVTISRKPEQFMIEV